MDYRKIVYLLLVFNFLILWITRNQNSNNLLQKATENEWLGSIPWNEYITLLFNNDNHQNLINDSEYCKKFQKTNKAFSPTLTEYGIPIKEQKKIFTDFEPGSYPHKVLEEHSSLQLPNHYIKMNPKSHPRENLTSEITMFFTHEAFWHEYHIIGENFLCEGQRYNHIPGGFHLSFKDEAVYNVQEYSRRFEERPHCFDPWKFMPYTLDLTHPAQCHLFFQLLTKEVNEPGINWIVKQGRFSHNGKGLTLIDSANAKRTLVEFDFGRKCHEAQGYIAQRYIKDTFLINNRKFDFRVYMLIANLDPLIILYHDGFVRITLDQFDSNSKEKSKHLTNLDVAENFLKLTNTTEENYQEFLDAQGWGYDEFEEYVIETYGVDSSWMDEEVRFKFKEAMLHLVRMNESRLLKHPGVFEAFGLDFIMDSEMNLYFIELNLTPCITEKNDLKRKLNKRFIESTVDLEYALMYNGDFDAILAESEFEWVFDGRKKGMEKYFGLISEDCI